MARYAMSRHCLSPTSQGSQPLCSSLTPDPHISLRAVGTLTAEAQQHWGKGPQTHTDQPGTGCAVGSFSIKTKQNKKAGVLMELEVSSNVSARAHGEEKHKMNFRNEHAFSVCQCDYTSPSHMGSWEGAGHSSAAGSHVKPLTCRDVPLEWDCLNAASPGAVPDPALCL